MIRTTTEAAAIHVFTPKEKSFLPKDIGTIGASVRFTAKAIQPVLHCRYPFR